MALAVQGTSSVAATTVTIPAHQPGDIILIAARRSGDTTIPTVPAAGGTVPTWVAVQSANANSLSLVTRGCVATASNHTSGTWTNATHLACVVIRPTGGTASIGASATGNANTTQTIVYPALTLNATDGTSMGVRFGTRVTAATTVANAPTGWTNELVQPAGAGALIAGHSRAALTSNPTADSVSTAGTNSAYRAHTVEIRFAPSDQTVTAPVAVGVGAAPPAAASVSYAFTDVPGATSSTYTLTSADAGSLVRCVVTATNTAGNQSAASNIVGPVPGTDAAQTAPAAAAAGAVPVPTATATAAPAAPPAAATGQAPAPAVAGTGGYADIPGATGSTYTPTSADIGRTVRCVVTATNTAGSATRASNEVGPVTPAGVDQAVTAPPAAVAGASPVPAVAAAGTVAAPVADATGAAPAPTVAGTNWSDISGATASTYTPVSGDVGYQLRCVVTATNASGSATATSNTVGPVTAVVAVDQTVTAPLAAGAGRAPAPADRIDVEVTTGPASATGQAPAPAVSGGSGVVNQAVTAPPADGTGAIPAPSVTATGSGQATAPAANAAGASPAPTVTADAALLAAVADALGIALPPTVTTTDGATVQAPAATGAGTGPLPVLTAEALLAVVIAEAAAEFPAPAVTAGGTPARAPFESATGVAELVEVAG